MEKTFKLITLPYKEDALAPVISAETIAYHYGKHLQTYVDNLNNLLKGSPYEGKDLKEIVQQAEGSIRNNAGQILNHELYFTQFTSPKDNNSPTAVLAEAIEAQFGTFDAFKEAFSKAAIGLFGSGWAWLSCDKTGKLYITQESNAGNPVQQDKTPLLTFDVWEHAYYIDYRNRRAAHIEGLWSIIDWEVIMQRYESR